MSPLFIWIITVMEWLSIFYIPSVFVLLIFSLPFYFAMKKVSPYSDDMSIMGYGPALIIGTAFAFLLKIPLFIKAGKLHDVANIHSPLEFYGEFLGDYATKIAPKIGNIARIFFIILKFYLPLLMLKKITSN